MVETYVLGAGGVVGVVVLLLIARSVLAASKGQQKRDRAHEQAQQRPPEEAAEKGETYELVVRETQYDRTPAEVRGTINGLQTFVRDIPDPSGSDALGKGDTISVRVTDYGTQGTTAQATFLGRV
jgi:predicted RNA-binding protein with TRAM domain